MVLTTWLATREQSWASARRRVGRITACSLTWAMTMLALAACGASKPADGSSDPVVARMIAAERAACDCKTLTCAVAADRELAAWTGVYRDDVAKAVADPTREAQLDVHRGRADACRQALAEKASPDERDAVALTVEDEADTAIGMMRQYTDRLCACPDLKCAEGVMQEMASLRAPNARPSKDQMSKAMKIAERMAECQKRLMAAGLRRFPDESPTEVATITTKKLAYEAYPQWSMTPSHQGKCPTTADLAEYVNQEPGFRDPWGNPYVIKCGGDVPAGARGIAVLSAGPDGRVGTADDLTSWER